MVYLAIAETQQKLLITLCYNRLVSGNFVFANLVGLVVVIRTTATPDFSGNFSCTAKRRKAEELHKNISPQSIFYLKLCEPVIHEFSGYSW